MYMCSVRKTKVVISDISECVGTNIFQIHNALRNYIKVLFANIYVCYSVNILRRKSVASFQ